MREYGLPKVLTWRWTPCAALTLGAVFFAGLALLAIPERIGELGAATKSAAASFGSNFASTQTVSPAPGTDWSNGNAASTSVSPAVPAVRVLSNQANAFPKRGFSPPLERPDPPAPPPAPVVPPPAPPPQVAPPAQKVAPPPQAPPTQAAPVEAPPSPDSSPAAAPAADAPPAGAAAPEPSRDTQ